MPPERRSIARSVRKTPSRRSTGSRRENMQLSTPTSFASAKCSGRRGVVFAAFAANRFTRPPRQLRAHRSAQPYGDRIRWLRQTSSEAEKDENMTWSTLGSSTGGKSYADTPHRVRQAPRKESRGSPAGRRAWEFPNRPQNGPGLVCGRCRALARPPGEKWEIYRPTKRPRKMKQALPIRGGPLIILRSSAARSRPLSSVALF